MAQVFSPGANILVRVSMLAGVVLVVVLGGLGSVFYRSPAVTMVGVSLDQPIPFSHQRHVGGNAMDCRYCHSTVEHSSFAGIPATETCMTCHSQVLADAPMLQPVHDSWKTGEPIEWNRVYDLPDFVYFDHSIHVAKGIGCTECHGQIQDQPLTYKANTLHMAWCLECHRAPERFIRPKDEVFNVDWHWSQELDENGHPYTREGWEARAKELVHSYNIHLDQLTNCSICHR